MRVAACAAASGLLAALSAGCGDGTASGDGGADAAAVLDISVPAADASTLPDLAMPPALVTPAEATDTDPAPDVVHVSLTAAPLRFEVEGVTIDGLAYNGQVPGPTIRARKGDRLVVDFDNRLDVPTTIHWHGLKVPYAMDGVTWQLAPVAAGGHFRYEFTLTHAGTFWYHPHFDSAAQIDRGLYGAIVVEDPGEPKVDRDLVLFLDAFGEGGGGGGGHGGGGDLGVDPGASDGGAAEEEAHGEASLSFTVNRLKRPLATLRGGESVRVRLINSSGGGYVDWRQDGARQIASDQGLLAALRQPSSLLLGPGDRAELEWLVGKDGFVVKQAPYAAHGGAGAGTPAELLSVAVESPAQAPAPRAWPFSGARPAADPPWSDIVYVLQGDGHRWYINGEVFPDVTIEELALGATVIVEVRNISATEHPFHLHGNVFEVLSRSGAAVSDLTVEDTVNVPIYGSVRLRLVADNPGDWMAHCHILPHAEGGMMTVLRVK